MNSLAAFKRVLHGGAPTTLFHAEKRDREWGWREWYDHSMLGLVRIPHMKSPRASVVTFAHQSSYSQLQLDPAENWAFNGPVAYYEYVSPSGEYGTRLHYRVDATHPAYLKEIAT